MMLYFFGALLGAAVGSFLGVVIEGSLIKDRGSRIFWGRSRCSDCKHQLLWWENIPLVSFVFLRGRCFHCHSPISWWLPLIEIAGAAAGIFVAAQAAQISLIRLIGLICVAAALIWIFFSDLVYGMISDWAIFLGSAGAILSHLGYLSDLRYLSAPIGAALFFWFLVVVTRGRGMGTGDITLAFFLGLLLGWPLTVVGIWFGFIIGAIWGVTLLLLGKKKFGQTIPFGPFLIIGALVALQWGNQLLSRFF